MIARTCPKLHVVGPLNKPLLATARLLAVAGEGLRAGPAAPFTLPHLERR